MESPNSTANISTGMKAGIGVAVSMPISWPARPPHDVGAAICAAVVFTIGIAVTSVRGAHDPVGE